MLRAICIVLFAAACNHHYAGGGPEPELTGCATDEHWRTFDDQLPVAVVDQGRALELTSPQANVVLGNKPILRWKRTPTEAGSPDGDVAHPAGGPFTATPGCTDCCTNFNVGALTTLHLPPVSGDVFDLHFTVGGTYSHRVITSLQAWTPPDALWESWRGKEIRVEAWRIDLLKNDVKGGPFTSGQALVFAAGPAML